MMSKKALKIVGGVLVALFFFLLLKNTNFSDLVYNIKQIPVKTLVILIIMQIFTQILLSVQWNRITNEVSCKSRFSQIFYIMSAGSVIEAITPGAKIGGEVTRLYYLKKELAMSTEKATSIIVIQKCISMSVLGTICVMSLLYLSARVTLDFMVSLVGITFSILLVLSLIGVLFFSKSLVKIFEKSESKIGVKVRNFVVLYNESTKLIKTKEWVIEFIISSVVWMLFPVKTVILVQAMGVEIEFSVILAITMTSYMVGMLPISPGGVGTFEGTMIALLGMLSVENAMGITITMVFRVVTFWFVILMSAIYVMIYKKGQKVVKRENKSKYT